LSFNFLSLGAQGANIAAGLYGSIYGAQASKALAKTQANVIHAKSEIEAQTSEFNAKVADALAVSTEQQGAADVHDFRRAVTAKLAGARAVRAASNLDVTTGSPLAVDDDTVAQMEYGVSRIAYNSSLVAQRYRTQGVLYRTQADYTRRYGDIAADAAIQAGDIKADAFKIQGVGDLFKGIANLSGTIAGRDAGWGSGSSGTGVGGGGVNLGGGSSGWIGGIGHA
jgi:hypothetical protein